MKFHKVSVANVTNQQSVVFQVNRYRHGVRAVCASAAFVIMTHMGRHSGSQICWSTTPHPLTGDDSKVHWTWFKTLYTSSSTAVFLLNCPPGAPAPHFGNHWVNTTYTEPGILVLIQTQTLNEEQTNKTEPNEQQFIWHVLVSWESNGGTSSGSDLNSTCWGFTALLKRGQLGYECIVLLKPNYRREEEEVRR